MALKHPISIAIADDNEVLRIGLVHIFSIADGLRVVSQYGDARAVLEADLSSVDVLVLEMKLPGVDGTALVKSLARRFGALKIVVFSMLPEEGFANRALVAGAAAFLPKNRAAMEVIAAIRRVHDGEQNPSEKQRKQNLAADRNTGRPLHQALSAREFEIMLLLVKGQKPTDIAKRLDLKIGTVTTHVHRIKRKLAVRSIGDLVMYGHSHQLLGA